MEIPLETVIQNELRYGALFGTVTETAIAVYLDSPALPDLHEGNRALRLRDDGRGPEAVAREVLQTLRARHRVPIVDIDAVAEQQGVGPALRRLGFTPFPGDWLLMGHTGAASVTPPAPGVTVERFEPPLDPEWRAEWIDTTASDMDGDPDEAMWREAALHETSRPDSWFYLARLDGAPASTCSLFRHDGRARIENVTTRPDLRRRGAATAVVARALADAGAAGDDPVYLYTAAGGNGERIYARLGFERGGVNVLRRHRA